MLTLILTAVGCSLVSLDVTGGYVFLAAALYGFVGDCHQVWLDATVNTRK